MAGFRVLICGGGVAALEGLLRLRKLGGDAVDITLLAPNERFAYRPLAVTDATGSGPPPTYPLDQIVEDARAELVRDNLRSVDVERRVIRAQGGAELPFDALLVAVGARQHADLEHVLTFDDSAAREIESLLDDVVAGRVRSVAFLVPEGPTYPLPSYELALITATRARLGGAEAPELHLVSPEPSPLAVFGVGASAPVGGLLRQAGVAVHLSAAAYVPRPNRLLVQPQGAEIEPDRMVAMPRLSGAAIPGMPGGGLHRFTPIDRRCAVPGTYGRIFAAGDITAFPVKHGGLAAQQADTAAAAIAHLAGTDTEPEPFRADIRAKLLTGERPLYLSARIAGRDGFRTEVSESPPWPLDDKIVALELGPKLAAAG